MTARPAMPTALQKQRLDKWLWFARVVKTRQQAVDLVAAGHVRIDSRRVDVPAKLVGPGAVLTIALERRVRVLRITGLAARRGGAEQAQLLFVDLNAGSSAPADCAAEGSKPAAI
ncbi:RNA-binding S4 domain-containing protein [uncultured Methylovirgula sp.]|uniref:RNA-binding S4 domain-containing protein n=1 Tax=uncultured Methylovirgula sp. TaxID=1285960 RepID=UPI003457D565